MVEFPERRSMLSIFIRRYCSNRQAILGAVIVGLLLLAALCAPLLTQYDPVYDQDYSAVLASPGGTHIFGTDDLGRDTFTRLVYGSRLTAAAAILPVAFAFCVGVPIGLYSGYKGGFIDQWVITRITRAQVIQIKNLEYVQAARSIGCSDLRIAVVHILPNVMPTLLVQITLAMASAIISEAGLSYIGLGASPEQPSWGSMLRTAQSYLGTQPWVAFFPGLSISIVVLGFNLMGDGLRRALDPKIKD